MEKIRPFKVVRSTRAPYTKKAKRKVLPICRFFLGAATTEHRPSFVRQQERSILDRPDQVAANLNTLWLSSLWRCCRQKDGHRS
jgi:hypothetical protein